MSDVDARKFTRELLRRLRSVDGQRKVEIHVNHAECQLILAVFQDWARGKR